MVTIDEIRQIAQLSYREKMLEEARNYPYMGHVLRKVSPYFTKLFIEAKVSANQVSLFSILFGAVGGLLFVFGDYCLMLIGCVVFYQLWNLFDCVDGEVARVTDDMSFGGRYLEGIHNPIIESSFMACFGIGLFRVLGSIIFLYSGFISALFICLVHYSNRIREWITGDLEKKQYVFPLMKKKSLAGRFYRSLYRKVRLFFLLPNTYLILTGILIFEELSPIKLSCMNYGVTLNLLSAYFFLYGFDWLVRTVVSGATNYRYLMRIQEK
jgi:phosphatidylglycerophosphate synthase